MAERIIELKWGCKDCGTKGILGRHKSCPSCGSPRERGEMSMDGLGASDYGADGRNKAATVTDPEVLGMFGRGPDWFCTHCCSGNKGDGDRCSNCAAPRYATAEEDHPDFAGEHKRVQGFDAKLEEEMNRDPRDEAVSEDPIPFPPPRSRKPRLPAAPPPQPPPDLPFAGILAGCSLPGALAFLGLPALACGLWWALTTHKVDGTVTGMSWSQTVTVDRWTPYTFREWQHKVAERAEIPPRNGSGEQAGKTLVPDSCVSKHYDDEKYQCGTREVCEDIYRTVKEDYPCTKSKEYACGETCRDRGNGTASCRTKYCTKQVSATCTRSKRVYSHKSCKDVPKYCTRPIFKPECQYRTQKWETIATPTLTGTGEQTQWPSPTLTSLDRASRSARYTVTISYADGGEKATTEERTTSLSEYQSWDMGERVTLDINNLGGVAEIHRLR